VILPVLNWFRPFDVAAFDLLIKELLGTWDSIRKVVRCFELLFAWASWVRFFSLFLLFEGVDLVLQLLAIGIRAFEGVRRVEGRWLSLLESALFEGVLARLWIFYCLQWQWSLSQLTSPYKLDLYAALSLQKSLVWEVQLTLRQANATLRKERIAIIRHRSSEIGTWTVLQLSISRVQLLLFI